MFETVPKADEYTLKMILHDWNDVECIKILSKIRHAATGPARVFVVEHVVPKHNVPHFSKLFDIHMRCWGAARTDRSAIQSLLERAGWVPTARIIPQTDRWASSLAFVIEPRRTMR